MQRNEGLTNAIPEDFMKPWFSQPLFMAGIFAEPHCVVDIRRLSGLRCFTVWRATVDPWVLFAWTSFQVGSFRLVTSCYLFTLLLFSFCVFICFLKKKKQLKNSRTPVPAGGLPWTECLIHPQAAFLWSHRSNSQFRGSQKEILLLWLIKQDQLS